MTYAIIALVVLLVVVMYLLFARKPKETEAPAPRMERPKRPAGEPATPRREAPQAAPKPHAEAYPTMPSGPPQSPPLTIAPETVVSETRMKAYFPLLVVRVIPPPDGALLPLTVEFVIVSPYFGSP